MKVAVIGSRGISAVDIGIHISGGDEIVSGGAIGIDSCAAEYAEKNGLKLTVFLPQYERYGRAAPIIRNKLIVEYADKIVAFWDGKAKGTLSVINYAKKSGSRVRLYFANHSLRLKWKPCLPRKWDREHKVSLSHSFLKEYVVLSQAPLGGALLLCAPDQRSKRR